jgi:predicted nucleic acid-binding protein
VVDNSIVMSWCFEDEGNCYADAVLESLEFVQGLAPAVWPLEVANVLLVAERKKRIDRSSVVRFLALLQGLPLKVEHEPPCRALTEIFALARDRGLSSYDASYLDLAMRFGISIATMDESLIKAAKHCSVPLFDPHNVLP